MNTQRLTFEALPLGPAGVEITAVDKEQIIAIALRYDPVPAAIRTVVQQHLQAATSAVLARLDGKLVGVALESVFKALTPFYSKPIPVVYQRTVYLDPTQVHRGMGVRLQVRAFREALGWLWPLRRFVVVCRTQSPIIALKISRFSAHYPAYGKPVPPEIREFAEGLLPLLGAEALDPEFRLVGPLRDCAGRDYTEIWERFMRSGDPECDRLMLERAFYTRNGRLYNRGTSLLLIGYARPLALAGLLFVRMRERPRPRGGGLAPIS